MLEYKSAKHRYYLFWIPHTTTSVTLLFFVLMYFYSTHTITTVSICFDCSAAPTNWPSLRFILIMKWTMLWFLVYHVYELTFVVPKNWPSPNLKSHFSYL